MGEELAPPRRRGGPSPPTSGGRGYSTGRRRLLTGLPAGVRRSSATALRASRARMPAGRPTAPADASHRWAPWAASTEETALVGGCPRVDSSACALLSCVTTAAGDTRRGVCRSPRLSDRSPCGNSLHSSGKGPCQSRFTAYPTSSGRNPWARRRTEGGWRGWRAAAPPEHTAPRRERVVDGTSSAPGHARRRPVRYAGGTPCRALAFNAHNYSQKLCFRALKTKAGRSPSHPRPHRPVEAKRRPCYWGCGGKRH